MKTRLLTILLLLTLAGSALGQMVMGNGKVRRATASAAGFTPPLDSVLSWYFNATNSADPVVPDSSVLTGNNGWINLGASSQPTRELITNAPVSTWDYSFDGGDYIKATNASAGNFSTNSAFTVAFSIKFVSGNIGMIMSHTDASSGLLGWQVNLGSDCIYFLCINGLSHYTQVKLTTPLPQNVWHRIVATKAAGGSASAFSIWTNGVQASLTTVNDTLAGDMTTASGLLLVGARGRTGDIGNNITARLAMPILATQVWSGATITNDFITRNVTNFTGLMP